MTDLFLIAHKVRGEPAFDIAERMPCPYCSVKVRDCIAPEVVYTATHVNGCPECDGDGHWWIVSTSGHRAYPYNWALHDFEILLPPCEGMPPSLPDHYPTRQAKPEKSSGKSLLAALGLLPKVVRRL